MKFLRTALKGKKKTWIAKVKPLKPSLEYRTHLVNPSLPLSSYVLGRKLFELRSYAQK